MYFHNTTMEGEAMFCPTPSELRNYWSNLQNSNAVRQIWRICRRKPNFADLGDTDDVTGQVKVKIVDNFESLVCLALEPHGMRISQNNDIDRVWDTSKYHRKLSVNIFKVKVIHGHEVKERSN